MLNVRNAYTDKLDNLNAAVDDILSQLQVDSYKRKHSIVLITCNSEYIDRGLLDILAEALPCEIVGITSVASSSAGGMGIYSCSVTLISSDKIEFSPSYSGVITEENMDAVIADTYRTASVGRKEKPSMIFVYAPLVNWNIDCAKVVSALDKVSGGIPAFGSFSIDHTADFSHNRTIYGSEYSWDRVSLVLVYGDINPTFLVASISDQYINPNGGIVTKAEGRTIYEVDHEPFVNFLVKSDLIKEGSLDIVLSPILIDFNDGARSVMRNIANVTEEGYGIMNSEISVGAVLRATEVNATDVLESAELIFDAVLSVDNAHGMLAYPCASRYAALGDNAYAGMKTAQNLIGNRLPYMMSYSGGEICPVVGANGELVNKLHNSTIVACVF
ncbi:MAG: FIST C-terminal domain-containing protein [Clostridiales Family XIII bacterium]|jgi:hypothetical protein|nr:FIST C-terminal domain-containing protein [Clostridiales Family XIII bacterium]